MIYDIFSLWNIFSLILTRSWEICNKSYIISRFNNAQMTCNLVNIFSYKGKEKSENKPQNAIIIYGEIWY